VWTMQASAVALAAAEGAAGLWIAFRLDAPPGACIAALSAAVFVVVASVRPAWEWGVARRTLRASVG
jgi:ABC-type Mn2+/Zn2+ transport system permease subunit